MHPITVNLDNIDYKFDISEHPHADSLRCKFGVHYHGKLVATFAPDRHQLLHLCNNYGNLSNSLINLICERLEQLHPYGFFSQT